MGEGYMEKPPKDYRLETLQQGLLLLFVVVCYMMVFLTLAFAFVGDEYQPESQNLPYVITLMPGN